MTGRDGAQPGPESSLGRRNRYSSCGAETIIEPSLLFSRWATTRARSSSSTPGSYGPGTSGEMEPTVGCQFMKWMPYHEVPQGLHELASTLLTTDNMSAHIDAMASAERAQEPEPHGNSAAAARMAHLAAMAESTKLMRRSSTLLNQTF